MSSIGRSTRRRAHRHATLAPPKRDRFKVELLPLAEALADVRRGSAIAGWLDQLAGRDSGARCECVLCCTRLAAGPASVLVVEPLRCAETVWVAQICADCAPQAANATRLADAVERELGLPAACWRQVSAPGLA